MRPRLLKGIPEKQNRLVSNKNFQAAMCRFFLFYMDYIKHILDMH